MNKLFVVVAGSLKVLSSKKEERYDTQKRDWAEASTQADGLRAVCPSGGLLKPLLCVVPRRESLSYLVFGDRAGERGWSVASLNFFVNCSYKFVSSWFLQSLSLFCSD